MGAGQMFFTRPFPPVEGAPFYRPTANSNNDMANPTNAYDTDTIDLDDTTYSYGFVSDSDSYSTTKGCIYSGFGSGTVSGTLYIVGSFSCISEGEATASYSCAGISGSGNASVFYSAASPYTQALNNVDLATFTVTVDVTGGLNEQSAIGSASASVYDILIIV